MTKKKVLDMPNVVVKESNTVIYVGPTIHGVVVESTIFNNGIPKVLNERIAEQPFIKKFIIPLEQLNKTKAEIQKNGSALNIFYHMIRTR